MGVVVHIDQFSGPMALLLHLIRQQEMDIFDINIQAITKQYLDSIRNMKKLNLELAGDFIAMAATLIQIKSKMLLPQYNEQGEEVVQEDPRKELVQKLIEYQMYQEAGQALYNRPLLGRNVWLRGLREEIRVDDNEIIIEDNALYALISTYRTAMKNMKKAVHRVANSLQSIADRIMQMRELLVIGQSTQLSSLVVCGPAFASGEGLALNEEKKSRLLITFLSLLELAKIGLVRVFQSDNFADIHVETMGVIDQDSISNVENYESQLKQGDPVILDPNLVVAESPMVVEESAPQMDLFQPAALEPAAEVNLSEDEFLSDTPQVVATVAAPLLPQDEVYEVQAATDEEIELEEKLYGEEKEQQEV